MLQAKLLHAQTISYEKEWGTFLPNLIMLRALEQDSQGNIFVMGNFNFSNKGSVYKFSPSGEFLWVREFDSDSEDIYYENTALVSTLVVDGNDDVLVNGITTDSFQYGTPGVFQELNAGQRDGFLTKLSGATGEVIWSTYFGGPENDFFSGTVNDALTSVQERYGVISVTDTNEIIWASVVLGEGYATSDAYQQEALSASFVISKFSENGQRLWTTYYGANNSKIQSILIDGDTFYVAGIVYLDESTSEEVVEYFDTHGNFTFVGESYNFFVSKFDMQGQRIWSRIFGGDGWETLQPYSLAKIQEILFIGGYTSSTIGIATAGAFIDNMPAETSHFLMALGVNADLHWSTYLGGVEFMDIVGVRAGRSDMELGQNEVYVLLKVSNPQSEYDNYIENPSSFADEGDKLLMKFNDYGFPIWGMYIGISYQNCYFRNLFSLTEDGFYYACKVLSDNTQGIATPGAYNETPANVGSSSQSFLLKYKEQSMSVDQLDFCAKAFEIAPNPVHNSTITWRLKDCIIDVEKVKLTIYDTAGRMLFTSTSTDFEGTIDVQGWSAGKYFVTVHLGHAFLIASFLKK